MILRKKNIILLVTIIVSIIILTLIVLGLLFLKTDMFKSNETLFAKYLIQNFDIINILKNENNLEIQNILNENKYISEIKGKVEYTENINTSIESRNNPINNVQINVKSNVDRINDYEYRNFAITNVDNNLFGLEYLIQGQNYGLRLQGIQQFVSVDIGEDKEILQKIKLENIEQLLSKIDIDSILNFSEEEQQNLLNEYVGVIQARITKDRYYKQPNSIITVDGKDIQTNAYYVKITIEEYNNIIVDILTHLTQDEIILSKIDLIENEISEKYLEYNSEETLRKQFLNIINNKIKEIQDNNIGNDEIKIIVYENNGITVRTTIEKNIETIKIDLNDSLLSINIIELENDTKETNIKIEKTNENHTNNTLFSYENMKNNEMINEIKFDYEEILEENKIAKKAEIEILNEENACIINILNDIELVEDFSEKVTLDEDNIKLSELEEEKLDMILEILSNNIEEQSNNLSSVVTLEDYKNIFKKSNSSITSSIEFITESEVSEIQKKRFNAQFEFFVSENLTVDNIKELINASKNNFEDIKLLLKTGEIIDLDVEKIENNESIDEIDEILIFIKSNTSNEAKKTDVIKFLEKDIGNMYNVFLQYNENGLVRLVRIEIQNKQ